MELAAEKLIFGELIEVHELKINMDRAGRIFSGWQNWHGKIFKNAGRRVNINVSGEE